VPYTHLGVHNAGAHEQLVLALAELRTEFGLPDGFQPEVLSELQHTMVQLDLPPNDLRHLPFLTVDPPTSRDLDQAMYLERAGNGYVVQYAIADVPSFVAPGGALDAETRRRGQTIYTPDGKVPLHPAQMSEDAASLLPNVDRPAFVWRIALDADANTSSFQLARAMIRSRAQLDYEQAQSLAEGVFEASGQADDSLAATLRLLKEIGVKRIRLEHQRGGASLNVPQQEVEFADGNYRLVFRPAFPIEDWNAQISLLTGMAAAELMLQGKVGILRTMPEPDRQAMERYRLQTLALGTPWPEDVPYGDYLRTLDTSQPRQAALMHAAASLFRGAGYTAFDGDRPDKTLQAAVAASYAHTTAPLRRLVDRFVLVTCEALCAGNDVPEWVRQALPQLPGLMAASDQLAGQVNRAVLDTVEAAILSGHVGMEFDAVVVAGPRGNGNGNGHPGAHGHPNGNGQAGTNGHSIGTGHPNGTGSNGNGQAEGSSSGIGNGQATRQQPLRSTIQIKDPAVSAYCEGALEPGTSLRVQLVTADIPGRKVLFRPVEPVHGTV
jgi:exoribonuclease R